MFPIFISNKTCRLEHVVNKLMSCLITEFLWIFSYKLHGILSNSMDTLWHSMELHRYLREPHDGISWNSTIFLGIPWTSKETPWKFMAFHGTPSILHGTPWHSIWNPMDTPWNSMAFGGIPWILQSMEVPWNSMDFHRFPWISIDVHGFPWNSIPWRYFTRDTANKQPRLRFHVRNRPCMCRQQWSK